MKAWAGLTGVDLSPTDALALHRLDLTSRNPQQPEVPRKSIVQQMAELKQRHDADNKRKEKRNG
jgi:hypothetical protein